MYPRSFLDEEAKIKQRTLLKKELCEIREEAIWESRFTSFCFLYLSHFIIEDVLTWSWCASTTQSLYLLFQQQQKRVRTIGFNPS